MTPEERAGDVVIVQEDCGDRHVADWRVNFEKTCANIADAIRAAVIEERERCAKILDEFEEGYIDPRHIARRIREGTP